MEMEKYFFCYSTNLYEFLRYTKGIVFICTAFHDKTGKRFWLFERDEVLLEALKEYNECGKQLGLHARQV
ncbi:hypothetical protein ACIQZD_13685 [Peribacillus sp. NPDC096447]|uniref:hypothetical protein n=1 Tax=Peribacillus sp. NPDC096447 TaxID=3364394 RepID=UPI0037FF925A